MRIPLFKIDHALLSGESPVYRNALAYAFNSVYQLPDATLDDIDASGKIDTQIILEICEAHHFNTDLTLSRLPLAIKAIADYVGAHKQELVHLLTAAPGALELLTILKQHHCLVGVLSGNIGAVAHCELEAVDLYRYIDFGAYGNMAYHRSDLIFIAVHEASNVARRHIDASELVIISNEISDIQTGFSQKVASIGLTNGKYTAAQLNLAGATQTANSLQEISKIMHFLED